MRIDSATAGHLTAHQSWDGQYGVVSDFPVAYSHGVNGASPDEIVAQPHWPR